MSHSSPTRRTLGAFGAGVLALAGLALTPQPASAAPWTGGYAQQTGFNYSGAGCSPSNTGVSTPMAPLVSNTSTPLGLSGNSAGTGPVVGDTGAMSASVSGSARINESAGSVTDFDVTANLAASASRALGAASACSASATAAIVISGTFSTTSAGLLDLDFSNLGTGFTQHQVTLARTAPGPVSAGIVFSINESGRTHRMMAVQPGDYQLSVQFAAQAASTNSAGSPGPSVNTKANLHGVFRPFGVAEGAASGAGAKYLTLADSQTCASHSVTADFTNLAGKKVKKNKKGKKPVIKKATFFVDGTAVTSVKKPNKNTLVTLTGLPADDTVEVSAQLKLQAKGKGTVTVERSYLPCS
jgi:hypothetical protein